MNKHIHPHEPSEGKRDDKAAQSSGGTRRGFIKTPLALPGGSIVIPTLLGSLASEPKLVRNPMA
jgi:hypothetical protein